MLSVAGAVLVLSALSAAAHASGYGYFTGLPIRATFLVDQPGDAQWNRIQLLSGIAYFDGNDTLWDAPKGTISDGASIPRAFWSIVGSPYTGPYLPAALIHDVGCDRKTRTWEDTHRAFLHAMLASNVSSGQAMLLFSAVYLFGRRWGPKETVRVQTMSSKAAHNALDDSLATRQALALSTSPIGTQLELISRTIKGHGLIPLRRKYTGELSVRFNPSPSHADSTDLKRLAAEIEADSTTLTEATLLQRLRQIDQSGK